MDLSKLGTVVDGTKEPESLYKKVGNLILLSHSGESFVNAEIKSRELLCKECQMPLIVRSQADIIICEPFLSCACQKPGDVPHNTGYTLIMDEDMQVDPEIVEN